MNAAEKGVGDQLWFHGASVGDLKSLHPIVQGISKQAHVNCVVSYWTEEARAMAGDMFVGHHTLRAPLPLAYSSKRFLAQHKISAGILEYLELYPAWIFALKLRGAPVGVINGRVTRRSVRIKTLLRRAAGRLDFFWAQSSRDAAYAQRIGVPSQRIEVLGSTKRERLLFGPPPKNLSLAQHLGRFEVVVGSLHADEEADLCREVAQFSGRVLIAPRYLKQVGRLKRRLSQLGVRVALRSELEPIRSRVVILDSIGELHGAYGLADFALVGGSFGRRNGQNLLEPVTMGCSVVFGPNTDNVYEEVAALSRCGVEPTNDMRSAFDRIASRHFSPVSISELRLQFPRCTAEMISRLSGLV